MSALSRAVIRAPAWLVVLAIAAGTMVAACDDSAKAPPKQVPPAYEVARTTQGHKKHLGKQTTHEGAARAIECKDCHANDGAGDAGFASPGSAPCATCHAKQEKTHHTGSPDAKTTCTTCHVFTPHDGRVEAPTCVECHAKPQGSKAAVVHHGGEKTACTTCHAPHAEPKSKQAACTQCHEETAAAHGTLTSHAPAQLAATGDAGTSETPVVCGTCHAPHQGAVQAKDGCRACHTTPIAAFVGAAMTSLAAQAPKVKPATGAAAVEAHACTTCHTPHAATKEEVKACVDCHADRKAVAANKGHASCAGCHQPHAPRSAAASCTNCHKGQHALGASGIASHAACTSCHDVHAPTKAPAAACATCHSGVHPTHPPSKTTLGSAASTSSGVAAGACIGCHAPHPVKVATTVAECTSCHGRVAPKDTALHAQVACVNCHKPHTGFALAGAKASFCADCHTKPAAAVAKGHAECLSCHGTPHAPKKDVACSGCHAQQASTAPKGHQSCQSCHAPHPGTLLVKTAQGTTEMPASMTKPAFCASCHADKPKALHGALAAGCGSCHRPHGPDGPASPPACTTCHDKPKLPGLHAMASHATCTNCHGGHQPPSATRATCTSGCHAEQKNHQPEAKVCTGCHVFRK